MTRIIDDLGTRLAADGLHSVGQLTGALMSGPADHDILESAAG